MVGVLIAGVAECYFLMDQPMPADSNMELTLLSHALDIAQDLLRVRGRALPANLHVQADNTSRELRNQIGAMWAASLVAKNTFRSVTFGFLPVGHTRIDIDQRFSVIASELARKDILQTPEAISCKCHLPPSPADMIPGSWFRVFRPTGGPKMGPALARLLQTLV